MEKGGALQLKKLDSLSAKDALSKFVWNLPSGSGEEDENVKGLQTDGQTDRRRTTGDQKCSPLKFGVFLTMQYSLVKIDLIINNRPMSK